MKIYFNEVVEKYNIDKIFFEILDGSLTLYNNVNKSIGVTEDTFFSETFFSCLKEFLKTHPLKDKIKYKPDRLHSLEFSNDIMEKDKKIKITSVLVLKNHINNYIASKDPLAFIRTLFVVVLNSNVDTVNIKYAFNDHKNTIWVGDESLKTGLLGEVSFYDDASVSSEISIGISTYPEDIGRTYRFFSFFSFLNENENTLKLNERLSEFIFEGKKLTQEEINTYDLIYDANFEKLNEYHDFIFPINLNKKNNIIKNKL